jgi:hypothetical protein
VDTRGVGVPRARRRQSVARRGEPGTGEVVAGDHRVVADALGSGDGEVLEGAGHAERGDAVRRQLDEVVPGVPDGAGGRPVHAGDHIEAGGLARFIWPDEGVDAALGHGEGDVVERGHTAEAQGEAVGLEGGCRVHRAHLVRAAPAA